jgi:single-stranded DNA-specific DHH superfamily exonuclease
MYTPVMKSFWIDFPVNAEQYSKLDLKWRRRQNFYEIRNSPPDLRIRNFCTFGGDDVKVISVELRGDINEYHKSLEVMNKWIIDELGEY